MINDNTFIIAELSANHNNSFDIAVNTIQAIADSGADAVKVQTYRPDSLTLNLNTGYFKPLTKGLWKGYTPWKLFEEASMPYDWQPKLKELAESLGLVFLSSPFDKEAVDFLYEIGTPIYKIASPEITDIPLIEHIASKGKPVIISTGLAGLDDIEFAIDSCKKVGNNQITILKCTSQYPAQLSDANLLTIPDMRNRFNVDVGVSDHTMGFIVPVIGVSLGATVVEKHFILDRDLGGPDSAFSMEPEEFKEMVKFIRNTEEALGNCTYELRDEDALRRRSLFAVEDIKEGELLSEKNIRSIRPGHGLHPKYYRSLIGQRAQQDMKKGEPLKHIFTREL